MRASTLLSSLLALTFLVGSSSAAFAQNNGKTFSLHASQTGQGQMNTLDRRHDISNKDPFSGTDDEGELLEAPKYKAQPVTKPTIERPKKPFNLQAQDGGNFQPATPQMAPQDMPGEQDMMPQQPPPQQPAFNPNDPDSSPDMQLAWDMWHRRVATAIFERFNFFAKAAFRHSPPLIARVSYVVTRDGHIINANMQQKATNVLFNVLCFQAVKSLDGDMSLLQFPEGSRRMFVNKAGQFTQNYGGQAGFRYQVGDRETVQGAGRR